MIETSQTLELVPSPKRHALFMEGSEVGALGGPTQIGVGPTLDGREARDGGQCT